MVASKLLNIFGIPDDLPEDKKAVYRSRVIRHTNELLSNGKWGDIEIVISSNSQPASFISKVQGMLPHRQDAHQRRSDEDELTIEERAKQYSAQKPLFDFNFLVVPDSVMDNLMLAVSLIELEHKVFDEWGLRRIEPYPRTALNFHGPPGTGKTLAAHAIASYLGKNIMVASYAQIESKYHGEGPKNVEALFYAGERDEALLFIDEADSLLSKRLTNVSQGSEQAINSMRSQLLVSLERFKGIVIFSTNLVTNYDKAFETRVRNVHFPMPDEDCRAKIWKIHLGDGKKPPLSSDVNIDDLAKFDEFCGRDIKNALIDASLNVAREGRDFIQQEDLLKSIDQVIASRIKREEDEIKPQPADAETSQAILEAVQEQSVPESK